MQANYATLNKPARRAAPSKHARPANPKKTCKKLLRFALYAVLFSVMIALVVYALYRQNITGYVDLTPAQFNTVILGDTTVETLLGNDTTEGYAIAFGTTLTSSTYYPGMEGEVFPFTVANGTTAENASQSAITYTVRLRILDSLPLAYSLECYLPKIDDDTGENVYVDGVLQYDETATTCVAVISDEPVVDENGTTWYEYSFYAEDDVTNKGVPKTDTTEITFFIDGGDLALNKHQLLLEWPIVWADEAVTVSTNDQSYMKEVESIQIVVTSSSTDKTGEDFYETDTNTTITSVGNLTSDGMIVVNPSETDSATAAYAYDYTYEIEHRAFAYTAAEDGETLTGDATFDFVVDNGQDVTVYEKDKNAITDYGLSLKVRYMPEETEGCYTITTVTTTATQSDGQTEEQTSAEPTTTVAVAWMEQTVDGFIADSGTGTDTGTTVTDNTVTTVVTSDDGSTTTTTTTTAAYATVVELFDALCTADPTALGITDASGAMVGALTGVTYQIIDDKSGVQWSDDSDENASGDYTSLEAAIVAQATITAVNGESVDNEDYRIYAIYEFAFAEETAGTEGESESVSYTADAISLQNGAWNTKMETTSDTTTETTTDKDDTANTTTTITTLTTTSTTAWNAMRTTVSHQLIVPAAVVESTAFAQNVNLLVTANYNGIEAGDDQTATVTTTEITTTVTDADGNVVSTETTTTEPTPDETT